MNVTWSSLFITSIEMASLLFITILLVIVSSVSFTQSQETNTLSDGTQPTTTPTVPVLDEGCVSRNSSCGYCVEDKKCVYCHSNNQCFEKKVNVEDAECPIADTSYLTCWVSQKTLWITIGSVGGGVFLFSLIGIYCCCCRGKKKDELYTDFFSKKSESRRFEMDEKRREREEKRNELRRKYGLDAPKSPFKWSVRMYVIKISIKAVIKKYNEFILRPSRM